MEGKTPASSALCPNCDRFIGPVSACPYCSASARRPLVLRALRVGSVVLAVLGLMALYLVVTRRQLPVVRAADITPMMNFAYVRVVGTVERDAYVVERDGTVDYLSFLVDDGTGSVRVQAQRAVAQDLVGEQRVPRAGMRVDCAGSLNVQADGKVKLRLQTAGQLRRM